MKMVVLMSIIGIVCGVAGCKPDLAVQDLDIEWYEANKNAQVVITNYGNADAGEFMVYFNAEEDPVSTNRRPQVSRNVTSLAKGQSMVLEADFVPLAHPDNQNLANVYKIQVIADPKNMVDECNEDNNEIEESIP